MDHGETRIRRSIYSLTSRHFHILANLHRHVLTVHEDESEERRELAMSQSDVVRLVWCSKATSQAVWEPIISGSWGLH
jgi:hypothetical protein